jgi:5'-3' exonuclease
MQDNIFIIDFMNYVHRCRVGNLDGEYVLIFNFFRNLRATIEQFKPNKIFFALEGHPKHRYSIYAEYKANRLIKTASKQLEKDKILSSANSIKKLLLLLPVTMISHLDFEADDIINTLCFNLKDENVIICSSDTDCIQILQRNYKNCQLYNPIKKEFVVPPDYPYIAYKCLVGDKSDNIPGLMGDKTAQKTLADPLKFDKLLEQEEKRAKFNINRQLIEFRKVPMDEIHIEDGVTNWDALKQEFAKMEFNSIINEKSWEKYTTTFNCLSL